MRRLNAKPRRENPSPAWTADDITIQAMGDDLLPDDQSVWLAEAEPRVRKFGVVAIRDAIPREALNSALEHLKVRFDVHMTSGQKRLFRTFQSDPLRAQLPLAIEGPIANPAIFAPPSVLALARRLLGNDIIIGEMGVVISHPGAGPQEMHRDSEFLFGDLDIEVGLPPFAMTMLVPLRDVTPEMGPTEFWLGTHMVGDPCVAERQNPVTVPLSAGSVTLCDARILHRGGANISGPVRPAVYFSFHRPWYQEISGYERKPQVMITPAMLQRLPKAYRPMLEWALHLNRTDSVSEFIYRWAGRAYKRLGRLIGR